jgi:hypothetical protein
VGVTKVDSRPPQPAQSISEKLQVEQRIPTTAASDAPKKEDDLLSDLAAELGPEATSMDPEQRRALAAMLAQMEPRNSGADPSAGQPSDGVTEASGANRSTVTVPAIRRRHGRR